MADRDDPGASQPPAVRVAAVSDDQWEIVRWLWQAFRQDLAVVVGGFPYPDGRYQAALLDDCPSADRTGYLAWRAHPKTGEDAPVAFALVDGVAGEQRSVAGFWVAPAARGFGIGRTLALDVLARHPAPWVIGFQQDNVVARPFWRAVADEAFGAGQWVETLKSVPGLPDAPPDHFIESQ